MRIGLYNLEPHIVNSAMMQVSQYWKQKGAEVETYSPLYHDRYDKVYAFSIFDFTDKGYVRDDMIVGGTGFDVKSRLPAEIEDCDYDWSLYPNCDFSMIWFSRGCIRNCPFCVVRQKEGRIHPVEPKNLNPNGEYIKVMDNNFFANPNWREAIKQLQEWDLPVDFQGFDIRIIDEEQCEALSTLKLFGKSSRRFKFAWDNPRDNIDDKIELLLKYIPHYNLMCYVLVGYWSTKEEDMYRIKHLWEDYHIDPFVMPFDKFDPYQKRLARWCNNKIVFNVCSFDEYSETTRGIVKKKKKEEYLATLNERLDDVIERNERSVKTNE